MAIFAYIKIIRQRTNQLEDNMTLTFVLSVLIGSLIGVALAEMFVIPALEHVLDGKRR